ncbi:hypothetical protein E4U53_000401 [Claviceps sorghi]|nr:hypothetical protein E4U53_000401 [Claviceps sorghi]
MDQGRLRHHPFRIVDCGFGFDAVLEGMGVVKSGTLSGQKFRGHVSRMPMIGGVGDPDPQQLRVDPDGTRAEHGVQGKMWVTPGWRRFTVFFLAVVVNTSLYRAAPKDPDRDDVPVGSRANISVHNHLVLLGLIFTQTPPDESSSGTEPMFRAVNNPPEPLHHAHSPAQHSVTAHHHSRILVYAVPYARAVTFLSACAEISQKSPDQRPPLLADFWLSLSTLFSSTSAFVFGLTVTPQLGVPISIIMLFEGSPFVIATMGFEKKISLTKAVLGHVSPSTTRRNMLEIKQIKSLGKTRRDLEDDGVSARAAQETTESQDTENRPDVSRQGSKSSSPSLLSRTMDSNCTLRFKLLMVSGFVLINIINTRTLFFSSFRPRTNVLGRGVSTTGADSLEYAAAWSAACTRASSTTVLSKCIVVALVLSVSFNGFLFTIA